jgi:D-glycero-alpha-D-manno-heptose 1-phosphate guanylyltransferase
MNSGPSDITAAILAGGMGTRLRPVVTDRPKVLAEVNGRYFIQNLLDQLISVGFKRVVLCTGYMAEAVHEALGDRCDGADLLYSAEPQPLGTGGSLRLALPLLASEPVLVMNGDSYCDVDLKLFLEHHQTCNAAVSLAVARISDTARFGLVELGQDNTVMRFTEKTGRQEAGFINAGLYLVNRSVIEAIPPATNVSLERDVFPALIEKGLYGFPHVSRFIDIGIPDDYYSASSFFFNPALIERY